MPRACQIGVVAEQTGLTVDAIRFYERQRLVQAPPRSEGGFRLFRPEIIEQLKFIRSAQELGLSLEEIRELLSLRSGTAKPCARVEQLLAKKLTSVQEKIAGLKTIEADLNSALRKCRQSLRETGCPVLEQIATDSRSVGKK